LDAIDLHAVTRFRCGAGGRPSTTAKRGNRDMARKVKKSKKKSKIKKTAKQPKVKATRTTAKKTSKKPKKAKPATAKKAKRIKKAVAAPEVLAVEGPLDMPIFGVDVSKYSRL
jgi:glycyl-tRNA synthetase (class II)